MRKYVIIFFFIFGHSCSYKSNPDIDATHYKYSWCNLNEEMDTLDLFRFIKDFELIFEQRKNEQKITINYLKPEFDVVS